MDGEGFRKFAEAYEPESGRVMEVWSDLPGVQLYTFNGGDSGLTGKDGKPMGSHTAFCLETQFYPDSVHHAGFPFRYLQPGVPFATKDRLPFLCEITEKREGPCLSLFLNVGRKPP